MSDAPENRSQFKDFVKFVATVKGDLSNISAPPSLLSTKSVVEFPASWARHQSIYVAQASEAGPPERALAVLKNYLCSLKSQQYTGTTEDDGVKKPLNAFLGELFIGQYPDDGSNGTTNVIVEQVSQKPSVTACYLYNKKYGISAEGYVAEETTFSAVQGVVVKQFGHAIFHIDKYNEDHLLTMPVLTLKNLLSGSPYPELIGSCYISSSSGYTSKIDFSGTSFLGSGKRNKVHAVLYHNDAPRHPLYKVTGHWNNVLTFHDCARNTVIEEVDVDTLSSTALHTSPLDQQDPWESRRAWAPTAAAIHSRDMTAITAEKGKVEAAQREMREAEAKQGFAWPRRFFYRDDSDPRADKLLAAIGQTLGTDRTNGVWKFIGVGAAEKIRKPYHEGLTPAGPERN